MAFARTSYFGDPGGGGCWSSRISSSSIEPVMQWISSQRIWM